MDDRRWTTADIADLSGRIAVVTGANSGIGFETAKALAAAGATVILACRNLDRAAAAAAAIRSSAAGAWLDLIPLDLADLASVRAFAGAFGARYDRLDLLIDNAGVMVPPFGETRDGFELQFGVNHLGHFALTGLLLDRLLATPGARVVTVSSGAHRWGTIDFDDLRAEKGYRAWRAYAQSKLANLLFTFELQRRFEAVGADALAVAAHPGYTGTNLQANSTPFRYLNHLLAQKPAMGALPSLYAATAAAVGGGDYYGPDGFLEMRGHPEKVGASAEARRPDTAERLWRVSEELTGVRYELTEMTPA